MNTDQHIRLKLAREAAGYVHATDAAKALGVKIATYIHHENGTAGLSRSGTRYAKFFKVDYTWLMTGVGEMRSKRSGSGVKVPIRGRVGASSAFVEWIDEAEPTPDFIEIPGDGRIAALLVEGDSQYPRFMKGETLLIDPEPLVPNALVGQYAVVQDYEGRRMIKMLRHGASPDVWRLESHNAPPEDNVRLLAVWRYLGVLAAPSE